MNRERRWDKEYLERKMLSGSDKPLRSFLAYLKYLKKNKKIDLASLRVLDLGCGVGRNSNYLARLGCRVTGIDSSGVAIKIAKERAKKENLSVKYIKGNIGEKYPFDDDSFDLVIDATSSNALTEKERNEYFSEVSRVISPAGNFFVRALLKDGDKNAQNLLKKFPGKEKDSYHMKELGITERVFGFNDFIEAYSPFFVFDKTIKAEGHAHISNKIYKRRYLIAYLSAKINKVSD